MIRRTATTLLSFALLAGTPVAQIPEAGTPSGDTGIEGRLSKALLLQISEVAAADQISAGALAMVATATGTEANELKGARFWRASYSSRRPPASGKVLLCRLPARLPDHHVIVAVDSGRVIRGAAVVDGDLQPVRTWMRLSAQLRQQKLPDTTRARPRAAFEQRRKALANATGAEDRMTRALIDQRTGMSSTLEGLSAVISAWQAGKTVDQAAADRTAAHFDAYAKNAANLRPLLGDGVEDYTTLARRAAQEMRAFAAAGKAGTDPQKIIAQSRTTCTSCHRLPVNGHTSGLQKAAIALRSTHGVSGIYLIGYDLLASGEDRQQAQALADALRQAALLLDRHPAL